MITDWTAYNPEETTLHEAFAMCGLILSGMATPGHYAVHPRGKFNETLTTGYPKALYAWLHRERGCPCDPYWLT